MSKTLETSRTEKPTLYKLAAEVNHLRERAEDLQDLHDLKQAIQRNGDKPLIPLAKVKKELNID